MPKKLKTSALERRPQQQIQQERVEQLERSSIHSTLQRSHHDGGLPRGGGLERGGGLQKGNGFEHRPTHVPEQTNETSAMITRQPLIQPAQGLTADTSTSQIKLPEGGFVTRTMASNHTHTSQPVTVPSKRSVTKRVQRNQIDNNGKTDVVDDAMQVDDEMVDRSHEIHNGSIDRQTEVIQRVPKMGMEFQILQPGVSSLQRVNPNTQAWGTPPRGTIAENYLGSFSVEADGTDLEYVLDAQPATRAGIKNLVNAATLAAYFHKKVQNEEHKVFEDYLVGGNETSYNGLTQNIRFKIDDHRYHYRVNQLPAAPQFTLGIKHDRFVEFVKSYSKGVDSNVNAEQQRWEGLSIPSNDQDQTRWGVGALASPQLQQQQQVNYQHAVYKPYLYTPTDLQHITTLVEGLTYNNVALPSMVQSFLTLMSQYVKFSYRGFINAKMNLPVMGRTSLSSMWKRMSNHERQIVADFMTRQGVNATEIRRQLFGNTAPDNLQQYNIANDTSTGNLRLSDWWNSMNTANINNSRDRLEQDGYSGISELDESSNTWAVDKGLYKIEHPMDIDMKDNNDNEILGLIVEVRQLQMAQPDDWPTLAQKVGNIALWANELDGN
ncbi:MAG: hypothetical protein AAF639_15180 [Chloroflexota bacterium]